MGLVWALGLVTRNCKNNENCLIFKERRHLVSTGALFNSLARSPAGKSSDIGGCLISIESQIPGLFVASDFAGRTICRHRVGWGVFLVSFVGGKLSQQLVSVGRNAAVSVGAV